MNKSWLIRVLLIMSIIGIICCEGNFKEDNRIRMIDTKRLLKAYGFKNGKVEGIMGPATDEGYIIATFLDPFPTTDKNVMQIVKEEIPANRIGALRILSLLLFKIAYDPSNKNGYLARNEDTKTYLKEGIDIILISPVKGEYKIPPMTFTDEEIMDFYSRAIRNKIEGIELKAVSVDEAKQLRELLIAYCVAPTKENGQAFTKYAKVVASSTPEKSKAIDAFMEELSPELKKTLGL